MDSGAKGLKGLEAWAKKVTEGYRDVNVKDMSTSFRDGLAFCAIIHHYRSDIIDFESLSKENIFHNNSLAFSTAEKQLGVPALLDAEDMVKFARPDRLSVITYLSQLHNCFVNENKVKKLKAGFKRILNNSETGPPVKVNAPDTKLTPTARHEVCQVCKHRVFLLERLIIDGKLYHRTCFKCNKCNSLLKPGAYIESDSEGQYECAMCPNDERDAVNGDESEENSSSEVSSPVIDPLPKREVTPIRLSPSSSFVANARNSFLQKHLDSGRVNNFEKQNDSVELGHSGLDSDDSSNTISNISVKDKISVFESSATTTPTYSSTSPTLSTVLKKDESSNSHRKQSSDPADDKSYSRTDSALCSNSDVLESATKLSSSDEVVPSVDTIPLNSEELSTLKSEEVDSVKSSESPNKIPSISARPQKYQSLFSRDLFQPSIKPLKLIMPSVRTADSIESASLPSVRTADGVENVNFPITPLVKYSEPTKLTTFNIPHVRSSYLKSASLSNTNSATNLNASEITLKVNESKSEEDLNDLPKQRDIAKRRRSSLESDLKTVRSNINQELDTPVPPLRRSSKSLNHSSSFNDFVSPPLRTGRKTPVKSSDAEQDNSSVIQGFSEPDGADKFDLTDSNVKSEVKIVPIPRVRRSLEMNTKIESTIKTEESQLDVNLNTNKFSQIAEPEKEAYSEKKTEIQNKNNIALDSAIDTPGVSSKHSAKVQLAQITPEIIYPDDLNPFGDDEEDRGNDKPEEEYPDDLNPFGDDEPSGIQNDSSGYDESKNPFASDEENEIDYKLPVVRNSVSKTDNSFTSDFSPLKQYTHSNLSSPSGSLTGTLKKRKAPNPPKMSDIFPNNSLQSQSDTSVSLNVSPSPSKRSVATPSPKVRKSKPAPPPPPTPKQISPISTADATATTKKMKEMDNMKLKSSVSNKEISTADSSFANQAKKKRPAPPVPIPPRRQIHKIPLKEIQQEMREIEEKQVELEKQGRDLEVLIRDRDKDQEPTIEEEESIMQLFELVNEKNALFRRQAELMYIKRSQRLEEEQVELEFQIRCLINKPKSQFSADDDKKINNLTQKLLDVVDQRNEIIESIEMDRKRELEEDVSVQEQIEIKNGGLPITAEIKEKSKQKEKKSKHKKDKKKKESEETENGTESSGKSTLKRKKWFSKAT